MQTKQLRNELGKMRRRLKVLAHDVLVLSDTLDELITRIPRSVQPPKPRPPKKDASERKPRGRPERQVPESRARIIAMIRDGEDINSVAEAMGWQVKSVKRILQLEHRRKVERLRARTKAAAIRSQAERSANP